STASSTEADAGEQRGSAYDPRGDHRRTAAAEQHLDDFKLLFVDNCWHRHFDDFGLRLPFPGLPELGIEAVATDVGRPPQHLVDGIDAPAPSVSGADPPGIKVSGDGLDPHRS